MNKKIYYYALSILGKDRVGIIKDVSSFLASEGINIDDSSMTRLRNEFAMILILASEHPLGSDFVKKIKSAATDPEFYLKKLSADEVEDSLRRRKNSRRIFSIKVYGADRTGIVAKISSILAAKRINIVDMKTRHIGDPAEIFKTAFKNKSRREKGVYILAIEAEPPDGVELLTIKKLLLKAVRSLKCHLSIDEYEPADL